MTEICSLPRAFSCFVSSLGGCLCSPDLPYSVSLVSSFFKGIFFFQKDAIANQTDDFLVVVDFFFLKFLKSVLLVSD